MEQGKFKAKALRAASEARRWEGSTSPDALNTRAAWYRIAIACWAIEGGAGLGFVSKVCRLDEAERNWVTHG